jgi:hypothetical protein
LVAVLALTAACHDASTVTPHVTGSIELTGQPPFTPDHCSSGALYGISGAWLFSRGVITSNAAQYHGTLTVKTSPPSLTYIWPSDEPPPTDGLGLAARSIILDPGRECSEFTDQAGHLSFDCTVADHRRLTARLDYKCGG